MTNYMCSDCDNPVKINQKKCKNCGAELKWTKQSSDNAMSGMFFIKKYRWISLIIIVIILFFLYIKKDSSNVPPVIGAEYINECERLVLGELKSPATAIFSNISYVAGETKYVEGNVDSENSFSAMMRSTFFCKKEPGKNMIVNVVE